MPPTPQPLLMEFLRLSNKCRNVLQKINISIGYSLYISAAWKNVFSGGNRSKSTYQFRIDYSSTWKELILVDLSFVGGCDAQQTGFQRFGIECSKGLYIFDADCKSHNWFRKLGTNVSGCSDNCFGIFWLYHTITFQLCFSTYFFVILKIRIKFAGADRLAEAPVWGLERRDAET